jgi:hypothetical protein
VQAKLRDTGAFTTVDTFNARSVSDGGSGTPTVSQLAAYHAVLVYSLNSLAFSDSALLGDRLAVYHDKGGGVVVAYPSNHAGGLEGAYGTAANGYALLDYASGGETFSTDSL